MNAGAWHKSSYSGPQGANCLEVHWHKSTYSNESGGNCVECRTAAGNRIDMRDSQHPDQPHLSFPVAEWRALLDSVRRDEV